MTNAEECNAVAVRALHSSIDAAFSTVSILRLDRYLTGASSPFRRKRLEHRDFLARTCAVRCSPTHELWVPLNLPVRPRGDRDRFEVYAGSAGGTQSLEGAPIAASQRRSQRPGALRFGTNTGEHNERGERLYGGAGLPPRHRAEDSNPTKLLTSFQKVIY